MTLVPTTVSFASEIAALISHVMSHTRTCTRSQTLMHALTHQRAHTHIHTHMHSHTFSPTHSHTFTHVHTHTHMHAHTPTHTHIHTHTLARTPFKTIIFLCNEYCLTHSLSNFSISFARRRELSRNDAPNLNVALIPLDVVLFACPSYLNIHGSGVNMCPNCLNSGCYTVVCICCLERWHTWWSVAYGLKLLYFFSPQSLLSAYCVVSNLS
jgi:hypothetical protein